MPEPSSKSFERLPKNVIPKHYDLWLKPDLKKCDFEGKVSVQVEVKDVTDKIVLNACDLTINKVEFKDSLSKTLIPVKTELVEADETCVLTFGEALALGHGELFMQFHGELNDNLKGLYRSKYTTPDGEERYAAVTQFESTDARRAFPCWDEPALKATFGVTLVAPKDRVALSNMNIISDIPFPANDQLRELKYSISPIMSTYLLAVVVGEYDYVETTSADGVNVKVYTPLGKKEQGVFALEVASRALVFYKDYFNVPYPLPKIDLIAIPDFASGAMENWGLVTYRETALLFDAQSSSKQMKERVAIVVTHELAHQWFGNLVTMEWWTHLWLNEGFASFMEYHTTNELYPEFDIFSIFIAREYNEALRLDALTNSHPIEVDVGHPDEIDEIFDSISYDKGGTIIRMLHNLIGDSVFRKGMHLYLTRHAYKNTVTEDLWDTLEEASGKPISRLMTTWTKQKGYPVISVSLKQDGDNQILTLSQEKFVADGTDDGKKYLWMVPISYITPSTIEKPKEILLDSESTEVVLEGVKPDDWVKLNPSLFGFYRVQYSEELLSRLKPAIKNHSLPLLDRLSLQSDLFAFVQAGRASTVDALKLMEAYTSETDYTVWRSLATCFYTLGVILSNTDFDSLFHAYCRQFFAKIFSKTGWEAVKGESHLDTLLRSIVINRLVAAEDEGVLSEAVKRFEAHVAGTSILPADLRQVVYKAAALAGDEKTFETLTKMYQESGDSHEEQERISAGIASFKDKTLVRKALEFALSPAVRTQNAVHFIMAIAATKYGRDLSWSFFQENKDELRKRYKGGFLIISLVQGVTDNFASEEKALEIESFFAKNSFQAIDRVLAQSLETIRLNSKWLARDCDAIKAYLSSRQ